MVVPSFLRLLITNFIGFFFFSYIRKAKDQLNCSLFNDFFLFLVSLTCMNVEDANEDRRLIVVNDICDREEIIV